MLRARQMFGTNCHFVYRTKPVVSSFHWPEMSYDWPVPSASGTCHIVTCIPLRATIINRRESDSFSCFDNCYDFRMLNLLSLVGRRHWFLLTRLASGVQLTYLHYGHLCKRCIVARWRDLSSRAVPCTVVGKVLELRHLARKHVASFRCWWIKGAGRMW